MANDSSGYYQAAIAGGNMIAAAADSRKGRKHQEKMLGLTQAYGREMADLGYQRSVDDWNRQNLYNLPSNQMGRLKDAGLNPHLIYGTGQASAGNASQAPQYHAPGTPDFQQVRPTKSAAGHLMDSLPLVAQVSNFLLDTEAKQLANEERRQEIDYNRDRYPNLLELLGVDVDLRGMERESKGIDLRYQESVRQDEARRRGVELQRAISALAGSDLENALKRGEILFKDRNYDLDLALKNLQLKRGRSEYDYDFREGGMKEQELRGAQLRNMLTTTDISKRSSDARISAVLANLAEMGLSSPVISLIGLIAGGAAGGVVGRAAKFFGKGKHAGRALPKDFERWKAATKRAKEASKRLKKGR